MKISIALCTYNGARFLGEQLCSIAAQTRLPDELVVCDDCSSDQTVEIVREFAASAPFPVRVFVNEKNLRVVKNFEKAIELCGGDVIALSDQDDVWDKNKLQVFAEIFDADPNVGLVFCDADLVDENLAETGHSNWEASRFDQPLQQLLKTNAALEYLLSKPIVWGCTMAFRRELKELALPIPADVPGVLHDYWISWIAAAVSRLEPVAQCLVKYRQHARQQLGQEAPGEVKHPSIAELAGFKTNFHNQIVGMQRLKQRLEQKKSVFEIKKPAALIESRLRHLSRRQQIHFDGASWAKRALIVAEELCARRYHLHSRGLRSAVKDLFLKS